MPTTLAMTIMKNTATRKIGVEPMYKAGMLLKSKGSGIVIKLISRKNGNGHWNTMKIGRKKAHMVHEGTLQKFYEVIE